MIGQTFIAFTASAVVYQDLFCHLNVVKFQLITKTWFKSCLCMSKINETFSLVKIQGSWLIQEEDKYCNFWLLVIALINRLYFMECMMDGGTLEYHGKPRKMRDGIVHVSSSTHLLYFIAFDHIPTRNGFTGFITYIHSTQYAHY